MAIGRANFSNRDGKQETSASWKPEPPWAGIIYTTREANDGHYRPIAMKGRASSLSTDGREGHIGSNRWMHPKPKWTATGDLHKNNPFVKV
jgi:hypothetical protein